MKKLFGFFLFLALTLSQAEAGFFSDLFEVVDEKKEKQFKEVEEEVISIDDYYDSSPEPAFIEEKVFEEDIFEEIVEETSFIESKNIFLSYLQSPKKVYVNQHFIVKIKAVLTSDNIKDIGTTFRGGKDYKVLNNDAIWKQVGEKSYTNSYIIKLTSLKATLPSIKVSSTNTRGKTSGEILSAYPQKIVALKENELFSNVLAENFKLISHHEKKYDDKSNIILLEINATHANLEDFHLPFATREGIDSFVRDGDSQNIYYFAILPNYQKELKFKYFNLSTNKFNRISFPIIISDSSVSTQTDLNPQKSKYFFYKVIGLLSLALLFLLLYMKYKKGYLLFLALVLSIYTIYTKLLSNNLTLEKDMIIRILPTENSTVFFKTAQELEVKVLLKKNGYTKVLLPNTKIGWIKDADITKN